MSSGLRHGSTVTSDYHATWNLFSIYVLRCAEFEMCVTTRMNSLYWGSERKCVVFPLRILYSLMANAAAISMLFSSNKALTLKYFKFLCFNSKTCIVMLWEKHMIHNTLFSSIFPNTKFLSAEFRCFVMKLIIIKTFCLQFTWSH